MSHGIAGLFERKETTVVRWGGTRIRKEKVRFSCRKRQKVLDTKFLPRSFADTTLRHPALFPVSIKLDLTVFRLLMTLSQSNRAAFISTNKGSSMTHTN